MAKNKFLKKFISLFLAVGMILCMMPVLAFSEANTTLTISNKEISANGSGNVTVDISANSQVSLIQFVIRYDTTKLQLNSATEGTAAKNPTINSDIAGVVYFVWDDTAALTAGGTLMTLNFSPKAGFTEGSSNIVFGQEQGDEFQFGTIGNDMKYVPTPVTKENGTITIAAQTPTTETYTVAYNANGGTGAPSTQTKTKGTALKLSSTVPTNTGYTFKYWEATDGATYAPGANYTKEESTTLKAIWEAEVDENAPQIIVSNAVGIVGKEVAIPVSLKNNPGIVSISTNISYDSSVMKLVRVEEKSLIPGANHSNDLTKNPYSIVWENDTSEYDFMQNGTLLNLVFEIDENAEPGDYAVNISIPLDGFMNYNADSVIFLPVSGVVTVVDCIIGDVNGDGAVTPKDRLFLSRYLAGWSGYETIDEIAADVNSDGVLSPKDRLILARHLAGWKGYETLPKIQ